MEEHDAIKLMLKILDAVCKKIQLGEKVEFEHLDQILEFLRTFADKCHHGKEESLLFPAMEKAGIPRESGPIGVMVREHEIGRKFIKDLSNAISDYKRSKIDATPKIVEIAKSYIELLTQHIEKEDEEAGKELITFSLKKYKKNYSRNSRKWNLNKLVQISMKNYSES